jgi:hypothetical protein
MMVKAIVMVVVVENVVVRSLQQKTQRRLCSGGREGTEMVANTQCRDWVAVGIFVRTQKNQVQRANPGTGVDGNRWTMEREVTGCNPLGRW